MLRMVLNIDLVSLVPSLGRRSAVQLKSVWQSQQLAGMVTKGMGNVAAPSLASDAGNGEEPSSFASDAGTVTYKSY